MKTIIFWHEIKESKTNVNKNIRQIENFLSEAPIAIKTLYETLGETSWLGEIKKTHSQFSDLLENSLEKFPEIQKAFIKAKKEDAKTLLGELESVCLTNENLKVKLQVLDTAWKKLTKLIEKITPGRSKVNRICDLASSILDLIKSIIESIGLALKDFPGVKIFLDVISELISVFKTILELTKK